MDRAAGLLLHSWFEEASPVEHILTRALMPVREPVLVDRPVFVT